MFKSIITHRAINILKIDNKDEALFKESHPKAFVNQLKDGFGIEFDIQPLQDKSFVVTHDLNLNKLSKNNNSASFSEISYKDFKCLKYYKNDIFMLEDLLRYIELYALKICFLHLKSHCQDQNNLVRLANILKDVKKDTINKLVIFDLKPTSAFYLKNVLPDLSLAASVSHPYDIIRYGSNTGHTLISLSDIICNKNLYSWAWMDEWDRNDENLQTKSFVSNENISLLKSENFKIAAVSPELHRASPEILASECHQDAKKISLLISKWKEWSTLNIDAICTDYASKVASL